MFKNLIQKYSQLSKNTQIIIAFFINGVIIEIIKIIIEDTPSQTSALEDHR